MAAPKSNLNIGGTRAYRDRLAAARPNPFGWFVRGEGDPEGIKDNELRRKINDIQPYLTGRGGEEYRTGGPRSSDYQPPSPTGEMMDEQILAKEGAAKMMPQNRSLFGSIGETIRLLRHDMPEAGWETQSDFTPMAEYTDDILPGALSWMNPFPRTRGEEFGMGAEAVAGAGAGAGFAKAAKGAGRLNLDELGEGLIRGADNLDELTHGLKRDWLDDMTRRYWEPIRKRQLGARNLNELDEGIARSARLGNLDDISKMTRGKTQIPKPAQMPPGRVGRYGYGGGRKPKGPLDRDVEVPLNQLGGKGKQAIIDALRQLVD